MLAALVRFSVRHPGIVVALALCVAVFGLLRMARASLDVFPEFSPTQVVIQSEAPGLSAELVEVLVTQPVENALAGTAGIASMRSQSIPGLSVVTVVFADGSDIYRNRTLVGERLTTAAAQLPAGVVPGITPLTSSASTVLGLGVTSDKRSLLELRRLVDWTIRPHLLSVNGVADVNVFGGEVGQWQVQVSPARLEPYGLALHDVVAAAGRATGVRGTGFIESANQRIVIASEGQPGSVGELGRVIVAERGGQPVRLADVARVVDAAAPSISAAAINGEAGVFLMVQGQLGANTRAVTLDLERAIDSLRPLLAREGVTLHPKLFRPANFIETAVGNVQQDVAIGAALVVAVLFLFLYNARTAFISAIAIPLSLLSAMLVLQYFKVSLNIMVLGGLAIALGEVVDDAIIDCENIFRRLRENLALGQPRPDWQVVFAASMEVRSSVVYATFIVVLVFVPLLTLSGVAGRLFAPLGQAYILSILASLLVAVTVTPALSYLLLGRRRLTTADPPLIAWIKPRYERALRRIERRPRATLAATALVVALGIGILPLFRGEFIPPLKEGHYIVHMTAIPGTSESESLRIGTRLAADLLKIPGVVSVAQWVGRAPNGADTFGSHYSEFEIEIGALPGDEQKRILREIRAVLAGDRGSQSGAAAYPGVSFAVNTFLTERIEETVGGYAAPVIVNLFGPDLDNLDRDAQAVATLLAGLPGASDVVLQAPPGTPELEVRLRFDRLAAWGLSPAEVLETLQAAYDGAIVGQVHHTGRSTAVAVSLDPGERRSVSQVASLPLRTPRGQRIELRDIADVQMKEGRYKILHAGGKRLQTVTCNVAGVDLADFVSALKKRIGADLRLGAGTYVAVEGAGAANAQARRELVTQAVLAGVGVALLLFLAFGNRRNLLLTFANLPFALVGGVLAVILTGGWMSLGSVVGFVTLFGITLRNSIMLVSHYQHLVATENLVWGLETAVRGALERLPSILMTALVTALGLLPLALGSGQPGRELEGPMAIIIVGGLITSTVLNLLVLPTILLHYGRFAAPAAADEGAR